MQLVRVLHSNATIHQPQRVNATLLQAGEYKLLKRSRRRALGHVELTNNVDIELIGFSGFNGCT
jgi:hypothetical protein